LQLNDLDIPQAEALEFLAPLILNCVLIYNAKMREQGHGTDEIRIGRKAH